jgi:hypothetical protein
MIRVAHMPVVVPGAGWPKLPWKVAVASFLAAIFISCEPAFASADDARAPPSAGSEAGPFNDALRPPDAALRACEIMAERDGDSTVTLADRAARGAGGGTVAFATEALQGSVVLDCVRGAVSRLQLPERAEALHVEA